MKILGLSFFYHDSAAVLLVDGKPVAMSEEERISRKKHDSEFPKLAINFVLEKGGIKPQDLDYVIFYEKPFLKLERIIKNNLSTFPWAPRVFVESIKNLFLKKIWIRQLIVSELGVDPKKILFAEHHLSHAASAFYPSPFEKAAVLTVDGVGEWAVTTIGIGDGTSLKILKEIRFPHSLGLLYSAFTAFLGFEVNEGEYKVMGMAPYGKPRFVDQIRKLIRFSEDGSYSLDLSYFEFQKSLTRTYSKKFEELFGKPRDPKSKFFTRDTGWPEYFGVKPEGEEFKQLAEEQEKYADIAASIQVVLEESVVLLAKEAYKITGCENLCFAGGVALNSVANWKILEQTEFKKMFIQPAAGDGGAALGAAMLIEHQVAHSPRNFKMDSAYYGADYSDAEIEKFLLGEKIKYERIENKDNLVNFVATQITEGKVIGWFQGKFEWGPRALGSRSIVADPRKEGMKDLVNTKIKFREPYRPFAPSVLAEKAEDFFELPSAVNQLPARFMLFVVPVKLDKRRVVPAITHVDGSARPQLVFKDVSPLYYDLINSFTQKTGVPMIMNTSFNLKGEPIVNTPADAYSTFMRSGLDILVLGSFVVRK